MYLPVPMPRDRLCCLEPHGQQPSTVHVQNCYFIFRLPDGMNQPIPFFIALDSILKKTLIVIWVSKHFPPYFDSVMVNEIVGYKHMFCT